MQLDELGRVSGSPSLAARAVASMLGGEYPVGESPATCGHCAMIPNASTDLLAGFHPAVKCCTYYPSLMNHQVGAILADSSVNSIAISHISSRIRSGHGVTPLGIEPPASFGVLYGIARDKAFGRARSWVCPYYDTSASTENCTIWAHRNAVCRNWYCKHERGMKGQRAWQALRELEREIEHAVAVWCAVELGAGASVSGLMNPAPTTATSLAAELADRPAEVYTSGPFASEGGVESYYRQCWDLASELTGPDLVRLAGARAAAHWHSFKQALDALNCSKLPEQVRLASLKLRASHDEHFIVASYSETDPLTIPRVLGELLVHFEGRDLKAALHFIEHEHGVRIEVPLVDRLLDFGILQPKV